MDTLTNPQEPLVKAIEDCFYELSNKISDLKKKERKVHLIAISRKMPRIFEWIEHACATSSSDAYAKCGEYLKTIKTCGLVSEHAIPFILASGSDTDTEIIVIDDIILTGNSMKRVIDDIYACSDIQPHLITIYRKAGSPEKFEHSEFIYSGEELSEGSTHEMIGKICDKITSYSLPMELEFPTFHLTESYNTLKEYLIRRAKEIRYRYYEKPENSEDKSDSISVILEDELKRALNHDFARVRLFKKTTSDNEDVACLQVNAPRVLTVTQCQSPTLFSNTKYAELWKKILEYAKKINKDDVNPVMKQRMENRKMLSLVVWANYLFSFSIGMSTCLNTQLLREFPNSPQVRKQDIELLIGTEMADEVTTLLNNLALAREVQMNDVEELQVTDMWFAPQEAKDSYEIERYRSAHEEDLPSAIKKLFSTHFSQAGQVGETIYSLNRLYHSTWEGINGDDDIEIENRYEMKLNEALDNAIDNGMVSPFYKLVNNSSGIPCFRRFYRGGSNSLY